MMIARRRSRPQTVLVLAAARVAVAHSEETRAKVRGALAHGEATGRREGVLRACGIEGGALPCSRRVLAK